MTDSSSLTPRPPREAPLQDSPAVRRALSLEFGLPACPDRVAARTRLMHRLTSADSIPSAPATPLGWTRLPGQRIRQIVIGSVCGVILMILGWQTGASHTTSRFSSSVSTYTTEPGQRATITLPDGSRVFLNVGSRLDVPTDFVAGNRAVTLTGEAIFDVQPKSGTPFSVVAGKTETRVLGTNFLVRYYRGDSAAVVAVRDGKVAVGKTILTSNEQVTISERGSSAVASVVNERFLFATGVLAFRETLLRDAIPDLNRWYNTDIRLGDPSLASRRLTGDCTPGSLADLAEILELAFDLRSVRDGRILTLYPRDNTIP